MKKWKDEENEKWKDGEIEKWKDEKMKKWKMKNAQRETTLLSAIAGVTVGCILF